MKRGSISEMKVLSREADSDSLDIGNVSPSTPLVIFVSLSLHFSPPRFSKFRSSPVNLCGGFVGTKRSAAFEKTTKNEYSAISVIKGPFCCAGQIPSLAH